MNRKVYHYVALVISLFALNASGETLSYRETTDQKISQLGFTELREKLSRVIHEMDVPWDLTYYQKCLEREAALDKKYKNRKKKEDCSKSLTETLEHRKQRLELVVDALVLEIPNAQDSYGRKWFWSPDDLALSALTKMWNESGRFDVRVQKGWRRGDQGRSYCNGQIWSRKRDRYYRTELVGYDQSKPDWSLQRARACTYMTYQHLIYHSYRCILGEKVPVKDGKDTSKYPISLGGVAMVYAGYGTGWTCNPRHMRPKLVDGKKVIGSDGKPVMIRGVEPLRRANQFWNWRKKYFK